MSAKVTNLVTDPFRFKGCVSFCERFVVGGRVLMSPLRWERCQNSTDVVTNLPLKLVTSSK